VTESEHIVRRKLEMKRQAAALIRAEIQDLHFQREAIRYRNQLAGRIQRGKFDSQLSASLDAVQNLLDRRLGK
jgi:hypothetical protein